MRRMRKYVVAVAGLTLAMSAGLTIPAQATVGSQPDPSGACSDGYPNSGGEHTVATNPVTIGYEVGTPTGPEGAPGWVVVCYSTAATGSSSPTPAGGHVAIYFPWNQFGFPAGIYCNNDTESVVQPNCNTYESLTTQDPNPSSPGETVSGQIVTPNVTLGVFQTGAEAGNITTPGSGATSSATLGNTCLWVLGTQELPTCQTEVGATIANGDLPQLYGGICAVQQGNTCVVGIPGVQIGGDTANPTVNAITPLGFVPVDVPCARALQTGAVVALC